MFRSSSFQIIVVGSSVFHAIWWFWLNMQRFTVAVILSIEFTLPFVKTILFLENTFFFLHKSKHFLLNNFNNRHFSGQRSEKKRCVKPFTHL